MIAFVLLSAFIWGIAVAAFMQFTALGDFLSRRLTWFMTAFGCGGNLLLLLVVMDSAWRISWLEMVAVFFLSSIGPSLRGILQHQDYFKAVMDGARDQAGE